MRVPRPLLFITLLCSMTGCGGSRTAPTAPTQSGAERASHYLDSMLDTMQENSVNRESIDWTSFRAQVHAAAPSPQMIRDLYPAIRLALGFLNDHHSFYIEAGGTGGIGNPSFPTGCNIPEVPDPTVPSDIGYVRVAAFGGQSGGEQFAAALQDKIRSQDTGRVAGWIVDLRGNGGGNVYPMLAGVGPILGHGTAGYFIAPSYTTPFGYRADGSFIGTAVVTPVAGEYVLKNPNARVAVLADKHVASSGEATEVAFRARPGTSGTETCGVPSGNTIFVLDDQAQLVLTTSRDADRTRHVYDGPLPPDETITDAGALVQRAIAWLRSGS